MSSTTLLVNEPPKKEKCGPSFLDLLFGIDFGSYSLERTLFVRAGNLARRWWLWCGALLIVFGIATGIGVAALTQHRGSRPWELAGDSAFVLSCAASSFAFLALFVRFATRRDPVFDSFSENACGVYLVHFAFVSWLQLSLLKAHMSTIGRGSLVFIGASLLSWGTAAVLCRIALKRISQRTV